MYMDLFMFWDVFAVIVVKLYKVRPRWLIWESRGVLFAFTCIFAIKVAERSFYSSAYA